MTVDLLFTRARSTDPADALALVFGAAGTVLPPPPPPPIRSGLRRSVACSWGAASTATSTSAISWGAASTLQQRRALPWGAAAPLAAAVQVAWRTRGRPAVRGCALPWRQAGQVRSRSALTWQQRQSREAAFGLGWRDGELAQHAAALRWRQGVLTRRRLLADWQQADPVSRRMAVGATQAAATWRRLPAGWRDGRHVITVEQPRLVPVVPPPPVPPGCRAPDPSDALQLLFQSASTDGWLLLFSCRKPSLVVVPVRRVYMLLNAVSLTRVGDGAPVEAINLRLALDVDSWAWDFSAEIAPGALALVQPGNGGQPTELEASINGHPVRVLVESMRRDRSFGRQAVRIAGRGISAALAGPYQPVATFGAANPLTAQQIVDQVMPAGWTASFGLTPWLVPTGAWSHQGTPMSAAVAVAAAAGGCVQPHPTARQIQLLPRYPAAPWEWATLTPDLQLPSAVVQREAVEWLDRPPYNRVYLSGSTAGGVLGRVTRAGSAGDIEAPMITDALMTSADAVRQRGIAELSNTGRQALVTLRLPVLSATGIIRPGLLLRYMDGMVAMLGLVRAVEVSHDGGAEVWQAVKVETHVG